MQNYRTTSHSVYDLKYHVVWITKYRKILYGQVDERLRDLLREICKAKDVETIKGSISKDHVHLFISVPPYLSISSSCNLSKEKPHTSSYRNTRNFQNTSGAVTYGAGDILLLPLAT